MAETEACSAGSDPSKPIVDDQQEALGSNIQGQSEPSEAPLTEVATAQAPSASTTVDGGTASSTERQIRLDGVNKWCSAKDIKNLLRRLQIDAVQRVKKQQRHDFAFIYFLDAAARARGEATLHGHVWKGRALRVRQATPLDPERFLKRQRGNDEQPRQAQGEEQAEGSDDDGGGGDGDDGEGAWEGGRVAEGSGGAERGAGSCRTSTHKTEDSQEGENGCGAKGGEGEGEEDGEREEDGEGDGEGDAGSFKKRMRTGDSTSNTMQSDGDDMDCGDDGSHNATTAPTTAAPTAAAATPAPRSASDAVAPLHAVPYASQLQRKRAFVLRALRSLPQHMGRAAKGIDKSQRAAWKLPWLQPHSLKQHEGAPCSVGEVMPSPLQFGYRNKCEFTIGYDHQGDPCVGFQVGKAKFMTHVVAEASEVPTVPTEMRSAAEAVGRFIRRPGALRPYDKAEGSGFWRMLLARQAFGAGAPPPLLLVVIVQHEGFTSESVQSELDALAEFLQSEGAAMPPVQLRLAAQVCAGDGRGEAVVGERGLLKPMIGEPCIFENLLGLSFRISPAAFFQVNTPGAEQLCSLLRSLCSLSQETVLLDVCCGGGTIGLTMAAQVKRVIGIEINEAAVSDARANAERNAISNASFIADKAENAIKSVLRSLSDSERASLVAIVDPPRAGLHGDVLKALRACNEIERLIFVSCHAPAFAQNAVALCRPPSSSFHGDPFEIRHAYPVDLFPGTDHVELVVVLERAGRRHFHETSDATEHATQKDEQAKLPRHFAKASTPAPEAVQNDTHAPEAVQNDTHAPEAVQNDTHVHVVLGADVGVQADARAASQAEVQPDAHAKMRDVAATNGGMDAEL